MKNLQEMILPTRYQRMLKVVQQRTRYFSVILENLYDAHNISAILRTAEAYGMQDIHIIEDQNSFKVSQGITMGADKWLTLYQSQSVSKTIHSLKERHYKVYYADPHESHPSLDQLPIDQPFVVIMGQEKWGISQQAREFADGGFRIPLYGFVESFNVSVAFATIVSQLMARLRQQPPQQFFLSEKEQKELFDYWILENNFKENLKKKLSQ